MRKEKRLKMCALLLTAGLFSGCAAGGDAGQTADSSSAEISSEQSSSSGKNVSRESGTSSENQAEQTESSKEQSTPVSYDADLWDGFSKGAVRGDDYSYCNSTNTYMNDQEDRWGYVYQTISGEKEEKTITLQKKDAEVMEVVYVTDEALYYRCMYEWNPKKEKYKRGDLWCVPIKKTDGYDELLFEEEKCLFDNLGIQNIYVMDSLLYVNFADYVSSERKVLKQAGRSDFGIYDMETKKWLDLGNVPKEIEKSNYHYWQGVTEEGGFLHTITHISAKKTKDDENAHFKESIYFADRDTHELKQVVEGVQDEKFFTSYDSKAFFFSNGHSIRLIRNGECKDYLSEEAINGKLHEVWEKWTEESGGWDYGDRQWYLDTIRISGQGTLLFVFTMTDYTKEKLKDYEWVYRLQAHKMYYFEGVVLECPLVSEPSGTLFEADGETKNDLLETGEVLYDRADWEDLKKNLKKEGEDEKAAALDAYLPVLTGKEKFTIYEWDGKKTELKDCKKSETTVKQWIDKGKLDDRLFSVSVQDIFQTGVQDLWLSFWYNRALVLHQENGKVYGVYSKYLEDRSQVNQKGIFCIERRKHGGTETEYLEVQYPEEKEKLLEQAVFTEVAKEKNLNYYIGGKKVSEKKFEKWWGESMEQRMVTWK